MIILHLLLWVRAGTIIIITVYAISTLHCHSIMEDASGKCKWRVTLPPTKADSGTIYTITATSQKHGSIKISDVLFGDVWVCSGQSNMGFNLQGVRKLNMAA